VNAFAGMQPVRRSAAVTRWEPLSARHAAASEVWEVRGRARLRGSVRSPGDKSIAHRAVLLAALARGVSTLRQLPDGEDVRCTMRALQALGVVIEPRGTAWRVHGVGRHGLRPASQPIDCGNSGTTLRLLCGLLAPQPFVSILTGDASLRRRPMARIAGPLAAMGAAIECLGPDGRPPVRVGGGTVSLAGCVHRLRVDSAQVRSALLLAGLWAEGPTRLEPRSASRDHTERMLAACGVHIQSDASGLVLHPTWGDGWDAFDFDVPGDLSSAAFWIALAAAMPGARLRIRGVGLNPGRGRYLELLRDAGARVAWQTRGEARGEPWGDIRVEGALLAPLQLAGTDVVRCIDEVPALAAAAAVAGCRFDLRDAAELRVKESDRLASLIEVLSRFGARATPRPDGFVLAAGTALRPARVTSAGDHRIAMAAALVALATAGTSFIDDVACVRTSYPEFVTHLRQLAQSASS
jgi:3-phosphoshikimate 1-carboxyvinyltransferase